MTGLGTPVANRLIPDLIAWSGAAKVPGNPVPAWQGSSTYQNGGSRAGSLPHTTSPAGSAGTVNGRRFVANVELAQAAVPPALVTTAAAQAAPSPVRATVPVAAGATAAGLPAGLSVFSQPGPLVLERWSENAYGQANLLQALLASQDEGYTLKTPGIDGDDGVLVGGAGSDMVIGSPGRNLMVGGFGLDDALTDSLVPGTADRDGVLLSALTGQSAEAFTESAEAAVLDQLFGGTGLDLQGGNDG